MKPRTEKTTVGEIDRDILAFTVGRDPELDLRLVAADCIGTAAHVTMLARLPIRPRLFSGSERDRVVTNLVAIMKRAARGNFPITLQDQDVHMAVERVLTRKLGDLGKRVHTARSRNDQVATDLRLFAKEELIGTVAEASALADALIGFARAQEKVPMVGRTHMQPAMPGSVGLWAAAHAEGLLEDMVLLITAYELNDQCPLGSAASYGVPLPIDREGVSDLLGFSRPVHTVLHANNARGKIESIILHAMAQVMITLSRLAQDLVLFTLPEFGYFRLPVAFCTGSSIMPQKRNPDVLELIRAKAARVLSQASAAAEIIRAAPSGYNRDLQEIKELFMSGIETTRASLRIMTPLVGALETNRDALRKAFTPDIFAADRALELVAGGMTFRDAYHHVKAHLADLRGMDPDEAIARKKHLGAPAGIDFDLLAGRSAQATAFAIEEQADFHSTVSRLLGVRYPLR